MTWADRATVLVGILSLIGVVWAALISRRHDRDQQRVSQQHDRDQQQVSQQHDREQQIRVVQLPPAQELVVSAYAALAALRYVTPPQRTSPAHRNEHLLTDGDGRSKRFLSSEVALDRVRAARAAVRVAFHPNSQEATLSTRVLGDLRDALGLAKDFYVRYDQHSSVGTSDPWRDEEGEQLRLRYKQRRWDTYNRVDHFAAEVAARMVTPRWGPVEQTQLDLGQPPPQAHRGR